MDIFFLNLFLKRQIIQNLMCSLCTKILLQRFYKFIETWFKIEKYKNWIKIYNSQTGWHIIKITAFWNWCTLTLFVLAMFVNTGCFIKDGQNIKWW